MRLFRLCTCSMITVLALMQPAGAQPPQQPPPDPVAPRAVVRNRPPEELLREDVNAFLSRLNRMPEPAVFDCWTYIKGARPGYFGATEWGAWWKGERGKGIRLDNLTLEKMEAGTARVRLDYTLQTEPPGQPASEKFILHWGAPAGMREQPVWQFVPEPPGARDWFHNSPVRWAIYVIAQQPGSLSRFRAALSMQNQKQLALGYMQFMQDWDKRAAFAPEFAFDALQPYLPMDSLWLIPGTKQRYSFNARLSDKTSAQMGNTANIILWYEGVDEKPLFHYDGKAAICMADGHVELVSPERFAQLRWDP